MTRSSREFEEALERAFAKPKAVDEVCVIDLNDKRLFRCGKGPFDWVAGPSRMVIYTDDDPDLINKQVRAALLAANDASVVPTLMVVSGILSKVGYLNVARVRRNGQAIDSAEVCVPQILVATVDVLQGLLPAAAQLLHRNRKGLSVPTSTVPTGPLKAMLASGDFPEFQVVRSVGTVPIVSLDGRVHSDVGYYGAPDYHLITEDMETDWRTVPDVPTDEDRAEALGYFDTLLAGFPFAGPAEANPSRANALAYLLTPALRGHVGLTPVFVFDATASQTGKTLLASAGQIMWLGAVDLTTLPGDREEMRKTLLAQLLSGTPMVIWDNLDAGLDSGPLASVITAPTVSGRVLGVSKIAKVKNDIIHVMTGNKVQLSRELLNRSAVVRLDAVMPNPETRGGFAIELPAWAFAHRADLVWAAHVLIRSWWAAGKPPGSIGQLGEGSAFIEWARIIGGVLTHAGVEGFMGGYVSGRDDLLMDEEFNDAVPVARVLVQMKGWNTTRQILEVGQLDDDFCALFAKGTLSAKSLGHLLRKVSGSTFLFNGQPHRIVRRGGETPTYRLGPEQQVI